MSLFKKKKCIPDGKYRIIKIGKEALFEFIYESFMEKCQQHWDVSDATSVVNFFDIDWEKGEFIFAARNEIAENDGFQTVLDTEKLLSLLNDTTDTMFTEQPYIELSEEEIIRIQNADA